MVKVFIVVASPDFPLTLYPLPMTDTACIIHAYYEVYIRYI